MSKPPNGGFQFSIRFVLLLTFHAALLAAIFMFEVKTVPRYVTIYLEYKLMLPAATQLVIHISTLFLQYWYAIIPPLFLASGAILFWLDRRKAALAPYWTGIVAIGTALYIGISYVALQRPFHIEGGF